MGGGLINGLGCSDAVSSMRDVLSVVLENKSNKSMNVSIDKIQKLARVF
jgi:hypothetical protein